jgi:hypothetical protein
VLYDLLAAVASLPAATNLRFMSFFFRTDFFNESLFICKEPPDAQMPSAFIVTEAEEGRVRKTAALRACFSCVSVNRQCVGR